MKNFLLNNNVNGNSSAQALTLEPNDAQRLASLCGQFDSHIKQIETRLGIEIHRRGNVFSFVGKDTKAHAATRILKHLYSETESGTILTPDEVHLLIQEVKMEDPTSSNKYSPNASNDPRSDSDQHSKQQSQNQSEHNRRSSIAEEIDAAAANASLIKTKKATIRPRGGNQQGYVNAVRANDINFGIGPAGTGKTYLAVACAVEAFQNDEVERILLVRPAVEAGEKLGFLPGDLSQKVDPYLRPLYDALYEMLGFETVEKLIEKSIIEIAPLAYMRGRTLNNAYIILDESQNTTREQMKMFLTRIGFGSTAVITGDPSQVDLPKGQASGLKHAIEVLENVEGISFTFFGAQDVVRHPIVQRIVVAYEKSEARLEMQKKEAYKKAAPTTDSSTKHHD